MARSDAISTRGTGMELITYYVGQGACAVLRTDSEAIIVDALVPSANDPRAVILKRVFARDLADRKVMGLMLTSFDRDHADPRAVKWILNRYLPLWVMYPSYWKGSKAAGEVMAAIRSTQLRRAGTPWEITRQGVRLDRLADRRITDLSPAFDFEIFSPHGEDSTSSNNSSLVAKVTTKDGSGFSYLVTGDTEWSRWESIHRYFAHRLQADVLSAPHHGSKSGVHEAAIGRIAPHTVLISCGVDNQHSHPDVEATDAFRSVGARIHCTGDEGSSFITRRSWWGAIKTEDWDH